MNYHLKKLIDFGLVEKGTGVYLLTNEGKDYSNLMDDDVEFIEKQPKTSVLLHIVRKNKSGIVESLVCRRLRHPYFGKIGRLTGKVRFGETLSEAALRELYEETGLQAKTIILEEIYHKLRIDENGAPLQDTIFYRYFIKDTFGQFISKTPHQENLWLGEEDMKNEQYDFFDDFKIDGRFEPREFKFIENKDVAVGF